MNRKSIQRLWLTGIIFTALLLLSFGRPDVGAVQQSAETLPDYSEYKAEWREMGIPEDHIEAMIRQIPAVKASAVLDEILHASRDLEQHRLYPDDFAGRFVDDQGELHVLCTKGSSGKYAEILKDFPTVHIEEVEHAYNDLYQYALDQLSEDIPSAYVDQVNNGLCIELTPEAYKDKMSDQELEQVRQLEDGRAIPVVFKEAAPYAAASELWSGDSISGNGLGFTLGSCGYYNGNAAIVTCGHGLGPGVVLRYSGSRIGDIAFHRFGDQMYGDYSIAPLSYTNHTITNKLLKYPSNLADHGLISGWQDCINGHFVLRYGSSTGWTSGIIEATDIPRTYNGNTILGCVEIQSYSICRKGDSGGPNVIFDGSRYKICATTNAYNEVTPSIYNATPFELIVDKNYSPKTN